MFIDTNMFHFSDTSKVYLSSDRHIGHKNILKYDSLRSESFYDLEQHDEYILNEINKLDEDSYLIFLWDLHLTDNDYADEWLSKIKVKNLYWIVWNHDSKASINRLSKYFKVVSNDARINEYIYLNHYPPIDYLGKVNYTIEKDKKYIHWHDHNRWWKFWNNIYNIAYNWRELLYKLNNLINV